MKIKSISISTRQLEQTEHFYSDILELPLIFKSERELHYRAGDSTLIFKWTNAAIAPYHYAFNIPHSTFDAALLWALDRFSLLVNPLNELVTTFENWNAKAIYFYDNNGNLLEFIARYDLKDHAKNSNFNSTKLDCISEIGIVTEDPLALSKTWIEQHQLSYFKKSPPTKEFAVVGNDNGLLIFVAPNRNWYPTLLSTEKTLAAITIDNKHSQIVLNTATHSEF